MIFSWTSIEVLFDENRVELLGCCFSLEWWSGLMSESAEVWIDRTAKFAAGAHAWEEGVGRIAGDLHPSTNIHNNLYGEAMFAVLVPRIVKALLPLLGERPDHFGFNLSKYSRERMLYPHDYTNAAIESGTIQEKRGMLYFRKEWLTGEPAPERVKVEKAYARRAHVVYEAGMAEIDHGAYQAGELMQSYAWKTRAETLRQLTTQPQRTIVHTMPHVANLVHRAAQFTSRRILGPSPVKAAVDLYETNIQKIGERYTSNNIWPVSDALGYECIRLSNNLMQWDSAMFLSGLDFRSLDAEPHLASRAISQVLMHGVLKAVESRDMEAVAFMNNIAYCGWAMTELGDMRYSDTEMTNDLAWQWGVVGKDDLDLDPYLLRVDREYSGNAFERLMMQAPGLQRLLS